jgi:hypothetical protein
MGGTILPEARELLPSGCGVPPQAVAAASRGRENLTWRRDAAITACRETRQPQE